MLAARLLAALTVISGDGTSCPEEAVIVQRVRDAGIDLAPADDVRVRFSILGPRRVRVAEIEIPGATPRRLEHEGHDCASLAEATIALLVVLLDERTRTARQEPPASLSPSPSPSPSRSNVEGDDVPRVRIEAGVIATNRVVASVAAGVAIGVAWRASRWGSIGAVGEALPPRDHAFGSGVVRVAAATGALVGCAGVTRRTFSLDGCAFVHVGVYALSAEGFPIVTTTERAILAAEAAVRGAYFFTPAFGVFLRAGAWIPFTRLDVGVRGADPVFSTTSVAPKAVLGVEIRP